MTIIDLNYARTLTLKSRYLKRIICLKVNLVSLDNESSIEDNESSAFEATVKVGGKMVHKPSAVREIFNENSDGLSTDRLRHVRSYTKYVTADELDSTDGNEVKLDEMIMIGDEVCGKLALSLVQLVLPKGR